MPLVRLQQQFVTSGQRMELSHYTVIYQRLMVLLVISEISTTSGNITPTKWSIIGTCKTSATTVTATGNINGAVATFSAIACNQQFQAYIFDLIVQVLVVLRYAQAPFNILISPFLTLIQTWRIKSNSTFSHNRVVCLGV